MSSEDEAPQRGKTKRAMLALTREQSNLLGVRIEELIKSDMRYIVNLYVRKYQAAALDTFGWTTDDLLQHIRMIMFMGLATFDESKKFKVTTYLSTILYYQMGNFSKRCQSKKNLLSKMYCPDVMVISEETITKSTAEDWVRYSETFDLLLDKLTFAETKVLRAHLGDGDTLDQMERDLKMSRVDLISTIKSLKEKIIDHLKEPE